MQKSAFVCFNLRKMIIGNYWTLTSNEGQLSLAIPSRVGIMSIGDDFGQNRGKTANFCVIECTSTSTAGMMKAP